METMDCSALRRWYCPLLKIPKIRCILNLLHINPSYKNIFSNIPLRTMCNFINKYWNLTSKIYRVLRGKSKFLFKAQKDIFGDEVYADNNLRNLIICFKDLTYFNLKVYKTCFYFKLILANSEPFIHNFIDLFHLLANLKQLSTPESFTWFYKPSWEVNRTLGGWIWWKIY